MRRLSQLSRIRCPVLEGSSLGIRLFHHKFWDADVTDQQQRPAVQFDNGSSWQGMTAAAGGGGGGIFGKLGLSPTDAELSALECEAQLPSKEDLHNTIPSAADAEKAALSAGTIDYSNEED